MSEETLDRYYFVVTSKHTGENGKVPKEFINVGELWSRRSLSDDSVDIEFRTYFLM